MQLPLTSAEAGAGLVPPATALFVLGKGGATLILIMLFMAVTSTGSAELIAVSSLISYDVYRAYINKEATGEQILKVSRITVFVFGALMGVLSIILNEIGLNLGWVYLFMGVVIGSAVVPVSLVLTWKKATAKVRYRFWCLALDWGVLITSPLLRTRALSARAPLRHGRRALFPSSFTFAGSHCWPWDRVLCFVDYMGPFSSPLCHVVENMSRVPSPEP